MASLHLTCVTGMNTSGGAYSLGVHLHNNTNITDCELSEPEATPLKMLITVVGIYMTGLLCSFGILGNILSFIVLGRDNSRLPMFLILRALAVSDSLLLLTVLIVQVMTAGYPFTGLFRGLYKIHGYINISIWPMIMMAQMGSVYLTILVSIERWIAVCHPLRANSFCTLKRARLSVFGVMGLAIVYNIPRFLEYNTVMEHDNTTMNLVSISMKKSLLGQNDIYRYLYCLLLYFIFLFLVPLVAITIMNAKLVYTLRRAKNKWGSMNKKLKKEHKITVIPVCIVVVFYVCATPALLINIVDSLFPDLRNKVYDTYIVIANMLVTLNSACNFIIYCMLGKKFRHILWSLICGRPRTRDYITAKSSEYGDESL